MKKGADAKNKYLTSYTVCDKSWI